MAADLPRRPLAATPGFRRRRRRRVAWRRRRQATLAPNSWRERQRLRGHRYHAGLRRWPRRILLATASLVVVAILLVIATVAYAFWRYHELERPDVANLVAVKGGLPFNVLLVGTTRPNTGRPAHRQSTSSLASVILLARVFPKRHEVRLVAVDPAMEVAIPTGSETRTRPIADALESGPAALVAVIASDFDVPVSDYLALKVSGVGPVIGALGGIHLDFAFPVRDAYTGLSIDKTGCQLVSGSEAQGLFQSRHLYYFANGEWRADLHGTTSTIARQGAVFAATVTSSGGILFDPIELNNLVSSVVANLSIDNKISETRLLSLADTFRGFSRAQLEVVTLPAVEGRSSSGHNVTAPATRADATVIARLLSLGTASPPSFFLGKIHISLAAGLSVGSNEPLVDSTTHFSWNPTPC